MDTASPSSGTDKVCSPCRSSAEPNARYQLPGTHVAWAGDSKSVLIRDREGNTGPFGIYQVFLDTLERRRLTQAPVGAGDWRFEVSPDGKTLAFIRYEKPGNRGPVRRPHARRRTAAAVELERNP